MIANAHVFQSLTEVQKYAILNSSCSAEDCPSTFKR